MTRLRQRTSPHSAHSIDRALMRVRILVGLAALVLAGHACIRNQDVRSFLAVAAAATVLLTVPGERVVRKRLGVLRTSAVITSIDTLLVVATLGLLDTRAGDPASLLLLLPLVQAGVRHGTLGALVSWFAVAAAVIVRVTLEWNGAPGQVSGPMIFIVLLLLIALPAAGLGDQLAERMHHLGQSATRVEARADVLADVLDANIAIAAAPPHRRADEIVDQARRLVHGAAALVPFDATRDVSADDEREDPTALLHDIEGRQMIRVPIGGTPPMVLTAATDGIDDIYAVEALELLAVTARTLTSSDASRDTRSVEAVERDDDATVEVLRPDTDATIPLSRRIVATDPDVYDRPGIERYLNARLELGLATQLALVSLDNLKLTNDLDGRNAGNALIAAVARRLSAISSSLAVAWLGGDEFLVLGSVGEPVTSLSTAIRHALEGRVDIGSATPTAIHSSVGVAFAMGGETAPQLVRQARETMFADKRKQNLSFLDQVEIELASHLAGTA